MESIDEGVKCDSKGLPVAPDWNYIHMCVRGFFHFIAIFSSLLCAELNHENVVAGAWKNTRPLCAP